MNRKNRSTGRVLITDDDSDIRWMLSVLLRGEGFEPTEAEDGPAAISVVRRGVADLMLLDLKLPGMSGLDVLREVRRVDPGLPVIMITGHGTTSDAVAAGKVGVQGFLTKPFKNDEVALAAWMALEARRLNGQERGSRRPCASGLSFSELMGTSAAIQEVVSRVHRVARTDFTVIIDGETGTGKEVVANAIHQLSARSHGPFVPVDCGSIPPTLIESELFGHEKGAFTGADRLHKGCFEAAVGGTLFLDEIGNLALPMQSVLLRALQERRITRVGSSTPIELDVRVICATNENLASLASKGKFRRDLFYRLNEFDITVPPLRARQDDICSLGRRFLEAARIELNRDVSEFTPAGIAKLLAYEWPGNVRELENLVRRAVLLAESTVGPEELKLAGIPPRAGTGPDFAGTQTVTGQSFREIVQNSMLSAEREVLVQALKKSRGNMKKAARELQMDYKTIRTKVKFHHLTTQE